MVIRPTDVNQAGRPEIPDFRIRKEVYFLRPMMIKAITSA